MKKLILASALIFVSLPSHADWTVVATTGIQDLYIDFKNVAIDGMYAKSMRLIDYYKEHRTDDGKVYWSTVAIYTYDCDRKMQQVAHFHHPGRMGAGDRLAGNPFRSDWEAVAKGSMNENYMLRACKGGD